VQPHQVKDRTRFQSESFHFLLPEQALSCSYHRSGQTVRPRSDPVRLPYLLPSAGEFIVLEHTEHGTAVIAKDFVKRMEYGSTGDYETSDVRSYCINDFYNEMVKSVGAENIIRHTVDLTADDGTGIKTVEGFVSILTTERYRRYRKFLKAMGEAWWTATRVTAEVSGYTGSVCYVSSDGILLWNVCGWGNGVRPFLILDSSLLVE